jgi:hypothetical protein
MAALEGAIARPTAIMTLVRNDRAKNQIGVTPSITGWRPTCHSASFYEQRSTTGDTCPIPFYVRGRIVSLAWTNSFHSAGARRPQRDFLSAAHHLRSDKSDTPPDTFNVFLSVRLRQPDRVSTGTGCIQAGHTKGTSNWS